MNGSVNEGGLANTSRRLNYLSTLRSYQKFKSFDKSDYLHNSQFLPSLSQSIKLDNLTKTQTLNSARLAQPRFQLTELKYDRQQQQQQPLTPRAPPLTSRSPSFPTLQSKFQ